MLNENPRIRLISQDSTLLISLTDILVKAGFEVSASTDPEEALPFVAHAHPEVVLCDHEIPGWEPMDILRRVKTLSPQSRFILLSPRSDWACYEDMLQRKGDILCPRRPLRPMTILNAVETALQAYWGGSEVCP